VAAMNGPVAVMTEIARSGGVDESLLYRRWLRFAVKRETATFAPRTRWRPRPRRSNILSTVCRTYYGAIWRAHAMIIAECVMLAHR
jgi:hypothetical protein